MTHLTKLQGPLPLGASSLACHHLLVEPNHDSALRALPRDRCLDLLACETVGRLAVSHRALPAVLPVQVRFAGTSLAITPLFSAEFMPNAETVVALEVGTFGIGQSYEWSVEVRGILRSNGDESGRQGTRALERDRWQMSVDLISGWSIEREASVTA